jgi:hypothetical protein
MNLERQHILCEIEKLIAGYRDEIKLLAADGRNCDIVIGKILGASDVQEAIQPPSFITITGRNKTVAG